MKELFLMMNPDDYYNFNIAKRVYRYQVYIAVFKQLPMLIFMSVETFEQGHTFGNFLVFSTALSLIMYMNAIGAYYPMFLQQSSMKDESYGKRCACSSIKSILLLSMVTLPYLFGFFVYGNYFNPDRTQWLNDNGFLGLDYDAKSMRTKQQIAYACLILVIIFNSLISYKDWNKYNAI